MSGDILEKGAIIQRDKETFAIAPHIPGGIVQPDQLRKIADVAEKYGAKAMKITSAQRIALVGLREEDIDDVWADLGMPPGAAIGLCVRSVKFCPGTTFCKRGIQDSVGMGMKMDERYHGMELPQKLKIAVSGCPNCCAESWVRDVGLIGGKKGWTLVVGGTSGRKPRIAQELASDLSDEEAVETIDRVINHYKENSDKMRLGRFIEEIGFDQFKEAVLS
ncbi:MAG: NAD(P)/FAD-dependent oxidoreductase [Methanomassiliicoccales archaeon]